MAETLEELLARLESVKPHTNALKYAEDWPDAMRAIRELRARVYLLRTTVEFVWPYTAEHVDGIIRSALQATSPGAPWITKGENDA